MITAKYHNSVSSSKEFLTTIKNVQVPSGYDMLSFDVKSLFTNVPLEYTVELLRQRIYNKEELTLAGQKSKICCCYARKRFISATIRISA